MRIGVVAAVMDVGTEAGHAGEPAPLPTMAASLAAELLGSAAVANYAVALRLPA